MYLRAATPAERQQWLVALGTAKACLTTMKHNGHSEMPGECKWTIKLQDLHIAAFSFYDMELVSFCISYENHVDCCKLVTVRDLRDCIPANFF